MKGQNKGLGSKPKETPTWKIGLIVVLGSVFLTHLLVVYVTEWYRVLKLIDWSQYYVIMDRMDNAVLNFWAGD